MRDGRFCHGFDLQEILARDGQDGAGLCGLSVIGQSVGGHDRDCGPVIVLCVDDGMVADHYHYSPSEARELAAFLEEVAEHVEGDPPPNGDDFPAIEGSA